MTLVVRPAFQGVQSQPHGHGARGSKAPWKVKAGAPGSPSPDHARLGAHNRLSGSCLLIVVSVPTRQRMGEGRRLAYPETNTHRKENQMNCSICQGPIDPVGTWTKGHNAWPINDGRCCSE